MKAFPQTRISINGNKDITTADLGMDLRDYFAGQIIIGFLANNKTDYSSKLIVELAYELADSMMKARDK